MAFHAKGLILDRIALFEFLHDLSDGIAVLISPDHLPIPRFLCPALHAKEMCLVLSL